MADEAELEARARARARKRREAEAQARTPEGTKLAPEPEWFGPGSVSGYLRDTGADALQGLAQGASFGLSDELAGALVGGIGAGGAALKGLANATPEEQEEFVYRVTGRQPGSTKSAYQAARDVQRAEQERAERESPWAYGAGELGGGFLVPVPAVKGFQGLGVAGQRAAAGLGLGALAGFGKSEADLTKGEVGGALSDVATGAATGMTWALAFGKLVDKLLGREAAAKTMERADINALKAVGLEGGITEKAGALGYKTQPEFNILGKMLREEGDIIRPFRKASDASERIGSKIEESVATKQSAIADIQQMAQELGTPEFNFDRLAQRANQALRPAEGWDPVSRENAQKAFALLGKASAAKGDFNMAEQVRQAVGKSIPWKAPAFGQALPEEVAQMRKAYGVIADEIANQAADVEMTYAITKRGVPGGMPAQLEATDAIQAMNKRISALVDAKTLADYQTKREAARGSVGLKDLMVAGTAAKLLPEGMDPVLRATLAAGAGLGARQWQQRAPSALTYAQAAAAKAMPKVAQGFEALEVAPRIMAGPAAVEARRRGYDALREYLGITPESPEDASNQAYTASQTNPALQPGRR